MGLFTFRGVPLGSAIPLQFAPTRWNVFLATSSWMIPITGLPGLLEESGCLPWPWGPVVTCLSRPM